MSPQRPPGSWPTAVVRRRRSWWGTASRRPQRSILTKLCLCTLPSTTHWTLLLIKSWLLVSASLWWSLYACCPAVFPERISVTTRDAPQLVAPGGSAGQVVVVDIFANKCQGSNLLAYFRRGTRWSHWFGPGRPGNMRTSCYESATNGSYLILGKIKQLSRVE